MNQFTVHDACMHIRPREIDVAITLHKVEEGQHVFYYLNQKVELDPTSMSFGPRLERIEEGLKRLGLEPDNFSCQFDYPSLFFELPQ